MKQLSHWGKAHPWSARLIIVFLYIPLNIVGILIGSLLYAESIYLSSLWTLLATLATLFALTAYPQWRVSSFFASYSRRKFLDAVLIVSTLLFVVTGANRLAFQYHSKSTVYPAMTAVQAAVPVDIKITASLFEESSTKPGLKGKRVGIIRKFIKKVVHFYIKRSESERIILLILTVLGAAVAVYLLAGLACSLACGGAEALASVVLIGGIVLVIWLTATIFREIDRKYDRQKRAAPKPQPTPPST